MDRKEIANLILKLLDCKAEFLVDEIYKTSQIVEYNLDPETFTGYFDENSDPICVGDMVRDEHFNKVGIVVKSDEFLNGHDPFVVDYPDNSWDTLDEIECYIIDQDQISEYLYYTGQQE